MTTRSATEQAWLNDLTGGGMQSVLAERVLDGMKAVIAAGSTLAGSFTTLTSSAAVALSPANANVVLSPTGTGLVTINPATAGALDNVVIGGTTSAAGTFTTAAATTRGLFGTATSVAQGPASNQSARIQVHGTAAAALDSGAALSVWVASTAGPALVFTKSRGAAIGTHGAAAAADNLGLLIFRGDDGTNFPNGAQIYAQPDGAVSAGVVPTSLFFQTANSGGTLTTALTLDSTQLATFTKSALFQSGTAIPAGGTAAAGIMLSSTANFGIFFGSSTPTLSAAKGSLYLRSDGTNGTSRMYVNTDGSTTWTAVTTSA